MIELLTTAKAFMLTHAATIIAYAALIIAIWYKNRLPRMMQRDIKVYTSVMRDYKNELAEKAAEDTKLRAELREANRLAKKLREENGRYREALRRLDKKAA